MWGGEPDRAGDRVREREATRGEAERSGDLARTELLGLEGERVWVGERSRVALPPRDGDRDGDWERVAAMFMLDALGPLVCGVYCC